MMISYVLWGRRKPFALQESLWLKSTVTYNSVFLRYWKISRKDYSSLSVLFMNTADKRALFHLTPTLSFCEKSILFGKIFSLPAWSLVNDKIFKEAHFILLLKRESIRIRALVKILWIQSSACGTLKTRKAYEPNTIVTWCDIKSIWKTWYQNLLASI